MSDHRVFAYESARCTICGEETVLPKDDETLPPKARQLLSNGHWVDVTLPVTRPDGSLSFPLQPRWDALLDFWIAHAHGVEWIGESEQQGKPVRRANVVLGPVTLSGGDGYRVIVVRDGVRKATDYQDRDDAEAAAEEARREMGVNGHG